jgi:lipopolysaccharide/colanic/teichoic acid biosynthesis glycosyltransferase
MAHGQLTAEYRRNALNARDWLARFPDVVLAATGLLIFSPLMALTALALWIESGRPVLFSQPRLGRFGRPFQIYKFRKYVPTASANGPLTVKDDPRLTKVGRFIESTKINELPQLWNVIRGDMSIVGPRPETLNFADCFSPSYLGVLEHRPGIFGPAQVSFRHEASLYPRSGDPERFYRQVLFPLKASMDLEYFVSRTVASDLKWIVLGIAAVVGGPSSKRSGLQLMLVSEISEPE